MDQAQTGRPENGAVNPNVADLFAHFDQQGDRMAICKGSPAMLEASGTVCETSQDGTILVLLPTRRADVEALVRAILAATGSHLSTRGGADLEWVVNQYVEVRR